MPELGIITLSRNTSYVKRLLDDMVQARPLPAGTPARHVIVNNSNRMDLTAAAIAGGAYALEPGYNTTFSAGNNMGARALPDADWLLLLNDDVQVGHDMLARMWDRRQQADILGALLLHGDGTVNHAGTLVTPKHTDHIGRNQERAKWERAAAPAVPAVTFAVALIRRSLWDELDGLDEGYRYGWEDTDFCLRAIEHGATIRCVRDAVAVHDECGTRPRGGAADAQNYQLFQSKWEQRIPPLLEEYKRRLLSTDRVEGA